MFQRYTLAKLPPVEVELQIRDLIGPSFVLQKSSTRLTRDMRWSLYSKVEILTPEQELLLSIILGPYL